MSSTAAKLWTRPVSPVSVVLLTVMWVLLWGDPSWGNVVAGFCLAVGLCLLAPVPRGPKRRLRLRPIAFARLVAQFFWDVIMASVGIVRIILSGRTPREAIIRVHTRAHSDGFLAATAGFTGLVPGSIVIDAHRLTGTLYLHVFDVDEGEEALEAAHRRVLRQEERILRALASDEELMDAGYRPGGSMRAGRLSAEEMAEHRAKTLAAQQGADAEREAGRS